ncbi:pentatricopeptide repeat-containing protein At3g28660-like [Telopea speciosissima]|uniref:pentatricopeptide repeat-containing protein At3g28660-like n=1 Tax=Telopea speciosissima TaxID=54955 RepID=UPI001CC36C30|nr:pentatricopeptide repeat-containing protein At3g28660-like [Telopea speciosissima]
MDRLFFRSSIGVWNRCMSLIGCCSNMQQLKAVHALFVVHGLHHNNYALSKLISFCALSDSGSLTYASLLFYQTPNPNAFFYNTLIRAYSRSSQPQRALHFFHLMLLDGSVTPGQHTFPFVLAACANISCVPAGKQLHCWVFKDGLASFDSHIQTALVRFYVDSGFLNDARKVFDEIPNRDVIQWNVLMNGYLRLGFASEALEVFRSMLLSGIVPDEFCMATALTACAQSGALQQGMWIHEYIKKRKGFTVDVFVGTALVDMYAKCGFIDKAVEAFEEMPRRNVFSWAAMIGGFAVHGFAREALHCLQRMQEEDGLRPDGIVLLGVLTACTHAGLQEEGRLLLDSMDAVYGVAPKHEHYSCTVDLLCRAGRLDEALELIKRMPMKPVASVWGSLLSGCRSHGNVELAELAVEELLRLNHVDAAKEDGAYVQLSNVYLGARRSDDARRIRMMIGDKGIKKTPGCTVIEVNGVVNEFVAGDVAHCLRHEIHEMLNLLSFHIIHQ